MIPKDINVLGVELSDVSLPALQEEIQALKQRKEQAVIVTPNPEMVVYATRQAWYWKLLKQADIALADGFGLQAACFVFGQRRPRRLTGIDVAFDLCRFAQSQSWSIYLLGGSSTIAKKASVFLQEEFPKLRIVGARDGGDVSAEGFAKQNDDIVREINEKRPDIVFVGFGVPKQEVWMIKNKQKMKYTTLFMGIGGAFDIWAGIRPRAPLWMRMVGLEWFWRLLIQPSRLSRIYTAVIVFPIMVLYWKLRMALVYRRNVCCLILNNQGQGLIVKRKDSAEPHWQLPQGGLEKGESSIQAAIREMQEETGLTNLQVIHRESRFHEYVWPKWHSVNQGFHGQRQDLVIFKHSGADTEVKIDLDELSGYNWVDMEAIVKEVHPVRREVTAKAVRIYKTL